MGLPPQAEMHTDLPSDLYRRCQETYNNLPEKARYHTQDTMPKNTSGKVLVIQAYLMLNSLQSKLLIDRVAVTRGFPHNGQRLLNTALELIDLTNMFWIKRDQLMLFSSLFEWIVSGMRCSRDGKHLTYILVYVLRYSCCGSHLR